MVEIRVREESLLRQSATEVDHYQIQRVVDIYVTPAGEDLGRVNREIERTVADAKLPAHMRVDLRGMVQGMNESFKSFSLGFLLSFILLYLILIAQFRSFIDPYLIAPAIPMGFIGVLVILPLTLTTLNVMALIGMIPIAMKLGTEAGQCTPMARAITGGLTSWVLLTVFIVPAAYLLVYGRRRQPAAIQPGEKS